MKYLIGDILTRYIKLRGLKARIFAIDNDLSECNFSRIRSGSRIVSGKKLTKMLNMNLFSDEIKNEIANQLDSCSTETLIDVYNLIYNKELKNNEAAQD